MFPLYFVPVLFLRSFKCGFPLFLLIKNCQRFVNIRFFKESTSNFIDPLCCMFVFYFINFSSSLFSFAHVIPPTLFLFLSSSLPSFFFPSTLCVDSIFLFLFTLKYFFYYSTHYFPPLIQFLKTYNFFPQSDVLGTPTSFIRAFPELSLSSIYSLIFTFISSVRLMACLNYFKVSKYIIQARHEEEGGKDFHNRNPETLFLQISTRFVLVPPLDLCPKFTFSRLESSSWIFHCYVVSLFTSRNAFGFKVYFIYFLLGISLSIYLP